MAVDGEWTPAVDQLTRIARSGGVQSLFDSAVTSWHADESPGGEEIERTFQHLARLRRDPASSPAELDVPLEVEGELMAVRRHPFISTRFVDAAPAWTSGLAVSRRVGPITDSLGRDIWIDVFHRVRQLRFVRTPGGAPFLSLPIRQTGFALNGGLLRAGQSIQIQSGSLWFATGLVSTAPNHVFTGVRLSAGTMILSADVVVQDDEVVVPATVTMELSIDLQPPTPAEAVDGSEFAATVFKPPKRLRLSIRAGGSQLLVETKGSLVVWGFEVTMEPTAVAPQYRPDLNRLVVPMAVSDSAFTVEEVVSTHFLPDGSARIKAGGLALPAAVISPADLGEAEGVGALNLELETGLTATWREESEAVELGGCSVLLDGARLAFSAPEARARGLTVRPAVEHASAPASMEYTRRDKSAVHYFTSPDGLESVTHTALAAIRFPKPVNVCGDCVPVRLPSAQVEWLLDPSNGLRLLLNGLTESHSNQRPLAFGLTNAVLRSTPPRAVQLTARCDASGSLRSGRMLVIYGLGGLLPSLPDPYAANARVGPRFGKASQGHLVTVYHFGPDSEKLEFLIPATAGIDPSSLASSALPLASFDGRPPTFAADADDRSGFFDFEKQTKVVLLDVSSNASRFGVALRPPPPEYREEIVQAPLLPPAVQGLDLAMDGRLMVLMTLPAVQWEPVRAHPGPEAFPDEVRFSNSGVPTTIDVPSLTLVPVNPLAAYRSILENFSRSEPRTSQARFTLPFGMIAKARLLAPSSIRGAKVGEIRPATADLQGAHQLRLEAVDPSLPVGETPALPGFTRQLAVAIPSGGGGPTSILGVSVTAIFNGYLAPGQPTALVPVTQIDLSGHGESLFSQWANPEDPQTGVTKVEFQVLNGRAAHEVVQVKSILLPYFVPVVRTITLERKGNAVVTRHDSGWVAVRDGVYSAPGITTHAGIVLRASKVTNIRETGSPITVGTDQFVAVYFDTDLVLDGAIGAVPARRQLGYVKLSTGDVTGMAYADLIDQVGPMGGAVDTVISLGGGPHRMRLHRVGVGVAGPDFVMAAWGSLEFPRGGEWSVLEARNGMEAPAPVTADRGLPLIRQGAAGTAASAPYRFADPEDLFDVATPSRDYGILHSMGTQRAFYRRPRIEPWSPHRIVSTERPVLADPFILATAIGPFPRQADAIPLPTSNYALEIRPNGTWWLDSPQTFPAGIGRRTIRTAGSVRSDLDYSLATVTYSFDTADPIGWRFSLKNVVKVMAHTTMGDLMSMAAEIDGRDGSVTSFLDPKLKLGGPFDIVQDLMTIMQDLGVPAQPDVRMTNKWGLTVGLTVPFVDARGDDFKVIPGEPFPTIKFADTGLKIEIAVAPEADEATLELGGTPMFAIKSIPGLYVVAIIKFKLQLSTKSGTTYGFLLGVGIAYTLEAGPFELKGLFAITFFAVFGDTVLGYGVGFIVKLSAELPPIVAIEISLEGKLARLVAHSGLPDETVFQIAKLVFAIEVSVFLVFSISLEVETKKIEIVRGPLLESDAPDVL